MKKQEEKWDDVPSRVKDQAASKTPLDEAEDPEVTGKVLPGKKEPVKVAAFSSAI